MAAPSERTYLRRAPLKIWTSNCVLRRVEGPVNDNDDAKRCQNEEPLAENLKSSESPFGRCFRQRFPSITAVRRFGLLNETAAH